MTDEITEWKPEEWIKNDTAIALFIEHVLDDKESTEQDYKSALHTIHSALTMRELKTGG